MEPIPSILAWPGGGAPVQGAGTQTPVAGDNLATGFANELDGLAALLDSAGEKEATPDRQNASAMQLDLIAALVPQNLPLQPTAVAPTATSTSLPVTTSGASVSPAQPSLAATAQRAVVTDLSQIIDPGEFAQMQFRLPVPTVDSSDTMTATSRFTIPNSKSAPEVGLAAEDSLSQTKNPAVQRRNELQSIFVGDPVSQGPINVLAEQSAPPAVAGQAKAPTSAGPVVVVTKPTMSSTLAERPSVVQESAKAKTEAPPTTQSTRPVENLKVQTNQPEVTMSLVAQTKDGQSRFVDQPKSTTTGTVADLKPIQLTASVVLNPGSAPTTSSQQAPTATAVNATVIVEPETIATPVTASKSAPEEDEPTNIVAANDKTVFAVLAHSAEKAVIGPKPDLAKEFLDEKDPTDKKAPGAHSDAPSPVQLGTQDVKIDAKDKVQVVRHVREAVADTIRDLVDAKRPGQMVLRLQPEDLGTVTVTVKTLGPRVDAEVTASDPGLRAALAQHRHDLVAGVERRGLQMGDFTVGHEQAAWDASQQAGHRQQHGHPMRNDFEQASRLAGAVAAPTLAVAAYAAPASDVVDYVV